MNPDSPLVIAKSSAELVWVKENVVSPGNEILDPPTFAKSKCNAFSENAFWAKNNTGITSAVLDPNTGQTYAILKAFGSSRRLVTLDPVTGLATDIGSLGDNFSSLAFAGGTLYGTTGNGAAVPETLFRINPATVIQAYRDLETAGFVEIRQGAGTFVRELAPGRRSRERARQARSLVRRLMHEARRAGVSLHELRDAIDAEIGVAAS